MPTITSYTTKYDLTGASVWALNMAGYGWVLRGVRPDTTFEHTRDGSGACDESDRLRQVWRT